MTRFFHVAFGAVAYVFFFLTFLYLIAFVGDAPFAPQTVDRGPEAGLFAAIAINLALISMFGLQHSVMARKGFKEGWTRIVPPALERSVYVLVASAMLWILYHFWRPIPIVIWAVETSWLATLLWVLFGIGWAVVLLSTFLISHFELFGLKQVWRPGEEVVPQFRQPGFYRFVRHPLYSGFLLAFWAIPVMTAGHALFAAGMTIYVLIAIVYEERDLVRLFGDEYRNYRTRVGMLLPRVR